MKITFDTETNQVKLGRKLFKDLDSQDKNSVVSKLHSFLNKNTNLSGYEEDSMWMSYRYCVGRHTIASHMRAGEIASHCYGRMSTERSIFTAFDINREIEQSLQFGCGPTFMFPITSLNKIYTSALDIFCQFVEDFDIQSKEDLLKYYEVRIKLTDNERGYTFETITWEEYLRPQVKQIVGSYYEHSDISEDGAWEYFKLWESNANTLANDKMTQQFEQLTRNRIKPDNFYMTNVDDLMVWNHLVHLFDLEHHHKSILANGEEVEWYWSYDHATYQKEDDPDHYYQKEIGYRRIRIPVNANIGSVTTWIPDESIKEDIY